MLFTHDTEVALQAAAALVNTARQSSGEVMTDPVQVTDFVQTWRFTGRVDGDHTELQEVQALRARLEIFWSGDEGLIVDRVNELLDEYRALPQLVRHDGWDWHLHATDPAAPLAARLAVEAAMAMVDVVRGGELDRLGVCAAVDCQDVLVDGSKNRSRRFCGVGCANRTNVAAFRARRAGATPPVTDGRGVGGAG